MIWTDDANQIYLQKKSSVWKHPYCVMRALNLSEFKSLQSLYIGSTYFSCVLVCRVCGRLYTNIWLVGIGLCIQRWFSIVPIAMNGQVVAAQTQIIVVVAVLRFVVVRLWGQELVAFIGSLLFDTCSERHIRQYVTCDIPRLVHVVRLLNDMRVERPHVRTVAVISRVDDVAVLGSGRRLADRSDVLYRSVVSVGVFVTLVSFALHIRFFHRLLFSFSRFLVLLVGRLAAGITLMATAAG